MNIGWIQRSKKQCAKAKKENTMTFILWHMLAIVSVMAISFILGWYSATKVFSLTEK